MIIVTVCLRLSQRIIMWGGPYHWEGGAVQDGQEGPGCSGCCGETLSHDKVPSGIYIGVFIAGSIVVTVN